MFVVGGAFWVIRSDAKFIIDVTEYQITQIDFVVYKALKVVP